MEKRIRYREPSATQIIRLAQNGLAKRLPNNREVVLDFAATLRVVIASYVAGCNTDDAKPELTNGRADAP